MKHSLFSCLFLLLICLTNCTEDDVLSTSYLPTDLELETFSVSDPKIPVLNKVAIEGSKVTLHFTNLASPKKPEGGFELMLNGKRTTTTITPRLHSGEKNLTMSFTLSNAASYRYQIFARWNSGYVKSNAMSASDTQDSPQESESPAPNTPSSPNTVTQPSNPKQPVISNLTFNGSKVTLEFVNFSAPTKPEGGFELMLNGKRTVTTITPRLHSTQKNLTMTFTLDNPKNYYYQIYARWNSGYLSSEKFYPGQANNPSTPNETPTDDSDNDSGGSNVQGLPPLKLVKGYEFENNIGRNVTVSQDGLKVHHAGRKDGKVVSIDGVGAYHFRVTPGNYTSSDPSHRLELIPRNLPEPYFSKGWMSKWGQEYIYEMRVKLKDNYKTGTGNVIFLEAKNDYSTGRYGSLILHHEGDHYFIKQSYAYNYTSNPKGESDLGYYYDATGNALKPGIDFNTRSNIGGGYPSLAQDLGKWVTWTIHVKWTYDNSGFVRLYKNGKLFHDYDGPTGFKDDSGPYVKFGLYNSWWKNGLRTGVEEQESYVDYFRVYVPK